MSTYVYGFTRATHRLAVNGLRGVGSQPLRVLSGSGLAAVVSDAPEGLRAKRRDLEAHEAVLDALTAAATVLPMRFGTVAPRDVAVVTELEANAPRYRQLLAKLAGCVELNVKASTASDRVRQAVVGGSSRNDVLRTPPSSSPPFGRTRPRSASVRTSTFVRQRLIPALRTRAAHGSTPRCPSSARAVAGIARTCAAHGPLPPYSFVAAASAAAACRSADRSGCRQFDAVNLLFLRAPTWWTVSHGVDASVSEHYDPATILSGIAELSRRLDEGPISAEEFDLDAGVLLDRLDAERDWASRCAHDIDAVDPLSDLNPWQTATDTMTRSAGAGANLADVLERVLDKGMVIAGDIKINLLDIELLTIKLRLLVASVDKAKELGIDWWEHDPSLSSRARRELSGENERLRQRIIELEDSATDKGRELCR